MESFIQMKTTFEELEQEYFAEKKFPTFEELESEIQQAHPPQKPQTMADISARIERLTKKEPGFIDLLEYLHREVILGSRLIPFSSR